MKVEKAIEKRRSYRALEPVEINDEIIRELAKAASFAPSCYNNQPWKFIFIRSSEKLDVVRDAISKGNEWMFDSSCIIAVISKKDLDCVIRDRYYYQFDTGLAVGQMLLRATEMGLATHAIAGFSVRKIKKMLSIPEEWDVITLISVGKKSRKKKVIGDESRPERLKMQYVYSIDEYSKKLSKKVKH